MTALHDPPHTPVTPLHDPELAPPEPSRPLTKAEWIARELARLPGLTPAQEALGRRLKRDLADTGR